MTKSLKIIMVQHSLHYASLDSGWCDSKKRLPALSEEAEYLLDFGRRSAQSSWRKKKTICKASARILQPAVAKDWLSPLSRIQWISLLVKEEWKVCIYYLHCFYFSPSSVDIEIHSVVHPTLFYEIRIQKCLCKIRGIWESR